MQWQLKEESYMKKCLAILLCMAMLIGLPFSVQAVGTTAGNEFQLLGAYALNNKTAGWDSPQDQAFALYFNVSDENGWRVKGQNGSKTSIAVVPYKADDTTLEAQTIGGNEWISPVFLQNFGASKRIPLLKLPDASKGFSYWKEQGAVGFHLYIYDSATDAKGDNLVNGWTNPVNGTTKALKANTTYNGVDAACVDLLMPSEYLTVKQVVKVSDSEIIISFSDTIQAAGLSGNNGPLAIELRATNALDGNLQATDVYETWIAKSMTVQSDNRSIRVKFEGTAVADAKAYAQSNNYKLHVYIGENKNATNPVFGSCGECVNNGWIDGIWSTTTGLPLLAEEGKFADSTTTDATYREMSSAAAIETAKYDTLSEALIAAKSGEIVTLLQDTSIAERFGEVKADITLDLNGHSVTADNLVAFGQIIDSSDGKGVLITSQNTAEAFVSFQVENRALPLYDTDCGGYRFFSYRIINAGTKFDEADLSWVKYGFKFVFHSMKAYELLAREDNAAINVELKINGRSFSYRFSHKLAEQLYETVKKDFDRRGNYAITLKIKGLDALNEEPNIKACPVIYSSRDTIGTAETIAFRGTHDPYTAAKTWITKQIKENTLFSFDYNGVSLQEDLSSANPTWKKTVETTDTGWIVRYNNGAVETWSEITFDPEMASLEWTNYFKSLNETNNTYPISNILAIDSSVFVTNPKLTTANGSTASATDFAPIVKDLTSGSYTMQTTGGRSSQGAFPYFDISNDEYGVTGGIGWTGNWKAGFTNNNGDVSITAGMQNTNIELLPGEQMRTPMIMLQFFKGDQAEGHNDLRRLILKNYTPQENGAPVRVPQFFSINGAGDQDSLISRMQARISSRNAEGLWIDSTWYGEQSAADTVGTRTWNKQVGNWYFAEDRYPDNNMLKLGTWLEEQDKEFLLWFEPERVAYETDLAQDQYILRNQKASADHGEIKVLDKVIADPTMYLYNFADDELCDQMIDKISSIIQGSKITWYRQDFNIEPESYWSYNDESNRVGMTEIKYITNLYRYLDELVERNPGLMIDNCAAGGRPLDLEMMKRSVPLWRSDYKEDATNVTAMPDNVRSINFNLTWWLPVHGGRYPINNPSGNDMYDLRAMLSAGVGFGGLDNLTEAEIAAAMAENKVNREMMYGDYYMLSYGTDSAVATQNAAYQFYLPEEGRGYVMTFCPTAATQLQATYYLKGLQKDASYQVTNADTGEIFVMTGQELMTGGLFCTYAGQADTTLFYYNMV